ncbi:DUF4178 domain-containing protein [Paenibacillus sp. YYML68]|uniref:DUF4178 domain-containing protein n=1 Tax=Paenibacillus sp. YYML68 TaxID=2909250 RepID=UPI0024905A96|nr:DUF4178 domain-containing protein [Paenibacillus sp. YYML68]
MTLWKRAQQIINGKKPLPDVKNREPLEDTQVGDIISMELEEYVVSGKLSYYDQGYAPHRFAYYLQNGKQISCLLVEKGREYECFACEFVEGSLDDPNDVPTQLDLGEGSLYSLEYYREDTLRSEGRTDFRSNDRVMLWRYAGAGGRYFFLQWQDGKYVAMEGVHTPASQLRFMKSAE